MLFKHIYRAYKSLIILQKDTPMRKHYFAASGEKYRVRVEVVPHLEPITREKPRIEHLDFNIRIMDMSPSNTCGHEWNVTRQVKYNYRTYLRQEQLTTKRCEKYFFRKRDPTNVKDWKKYADYIADQVIVSNGQLTFLDDLGLEEGASTLVTTLRDEEIQMLVRKGIFKQDDLFFKPVTA